MVLCDGLLSLTIMFSKVKQCFSMYQHFISFYHGIIFHCSYTTFYLSTHQLMYIWVVSTCLLWIMLLWIFLYKFLCRYVFSFFFVIYMDVEFLGHIITVYLIFCGTARLFSRLYHFTVPLAVYKGFHFLISSPILLLSVFFILAIPEKLLHYNILVGVRW